MDDNDIELENSAKLPRRDVKLFHSDIKQGILTRKRENKLTNLSESEVMDLRETVQNSI